MSLDTFLADRIRQILEVKHVAFEEKKMMGGICFMVDDKMCVGVHENRVMARIGPDAYDAALEKPGCEKMLFTGREMKGFVFVHPEGTDMDDDLTAWIELCLAFNPLAKSSKKKTK